MLQVIQRQIVPSDIHDVAQQLLVAVQAQGKTADQVVLGGAQLFLRRALGHKVAQHLARQGQRLLGLVGTGFQANGEGTGMQSGSHVAGDAIGQATLFTHRFHQARGKAAPAQDVVAQQQRKKVRVAALDAWLAQQDLRLRRGKGDADVLRLRQRRHFGHGGQGGAIFLGRQALQQLGHQRIGLGLVQCPHHRHLGAAGLHHLLVEGLHIGQGDLLQRGRGGKAPIGMTAVHRRSKSLPGHRTRPRGGLLERRRPALALALPDAGRPAGLSDLAAGQLGRWGQHVGLRQAAQVVAQRIVAGPHRQAGTQIGPGLAQGVFIERGAGRLPWQGLHALAGHQRHSRGQALLALGITAAAAIQAQLHIHHRNAGAVHQPHLRTAGLLPLLNRQNGPGRI